ncbi:MAG: PAS domain S-box protein, partial [Verrucomicrobiota bacterium]
DGSVAHIMWSAHWSKADRISFCVAREMSEARQIVEALQVSQERFRIIFQHAGTGIAIASGKGKIQEFNAAYREMLGYSEEELRLMSVDAVTHPDDRANNLAMMRALAASNQEHTLIEKRYLRKDGGVVWSRTSVSAVRNASGEVIHFIAVTVDITEQRKAAEKLQQSQALLRMAGRIGRMGAWVLDLASHTFTWS